MSPDSRRGPVAADGTVTTHRVRPVKLDRFLFVVAPLLLGAFIATILYPVFRHDDAGVAVFAQILALVTIGAVSARVSPREIRLAGAAAGWIGFYLGLGIGVLLRMAFGHAH